MTEYRRPEDRLLANRFVHFGVMGTEWLSPISNMIVTTERGCAELDELEAREGEPPAPTVPTVTVDDA
jgi:hypothetical protein